MTSRLANVWTSSAGLGEVLVEQVLSGFPLLPEERNSFDLAHWTLLVPTRRAARLLEQKLFKAAGRAAMVQPRVRPIGDVDEDVAGPYVADDGLAPAISKMGQVFLMLNLIEGWANDNPQIPLARDVRASRSQAMGLAQSLCDLVEQLATENVVLDFGERFDMLELAEHRQSILSLLQLVQEQLPTQLRNLDRLGPSQRRNALLAAEARRIADGKHHGPIIAAGSTGTNPATRKLLKAIACHPHGAVILPGLDLQMEDEAWDLVTESHPQHAMKLLLAELGVARRNVKTFAAATPRVALLREVMRPAKATDKWQHNASLRGVNLADATAGLRLMEAPDRHIEARSIALLMREVLETPGRRAALVTPDRNLGQQVAAELRRWAAEIDDSGGEPLLRFGRAQLCDLVMTCVEDDVSPAALVALLAHPDLAIAGDQTRRLATLFEMACLRKDLPPRGAADFAAAVQRARRETNRDDHAHPALKALDDAGWNELLGFAAKLSAVLKPLLTSAVEPLDVQVGTMLSVLEALAPPDETPTDADRAFEQVMQAARDAASLHPVSTLSGAFTSLRWALRSETLRRMPRDDLRLAIYGLAEARMIEADLVILGGLNESLWPATVDPGPWFNRPMRQILGLAQPERDIGITAHDFAQAAAHQTVVVTWSKRLGTTPLTPSRFVLRLRAVLETLGRTQTRQLEQQYVNWALALDRPHHAITLPVPKPTPPVALRPRRFSVTAIEKLIRDPYGIFARRILNLEPLPPLGGELEPRLRGTLFHDALSRWLVQHDGKSLDHLLLAGSEVFADYMGDPEVRHFWWPRFQRMAKALVDEDETLRANVVKSLVEETGFYEFTVASAKHRLTARADRLDITRSGAVRFIDYKSGAVPSAKQVESGLSPQLTLEAGILLEGAFRNIAGKSVDDILYIQVGGGRPPVEVSYPAAKAKLDVESLARHHLAQLKDLLAAYQEPKQAYLPRTAVFKEDEQTDYDHLSRFAEWSRGGA